MIRLFVILGALVFIGGCRQGTVSKPVSKPVAAPQATPATTQPFVRKTTGTFVDRRESGDLRVVSYNVNWDRIFPDVDPDGAAKFERVMRALDADIVALQELRDNDAASASALMDWIVPLPGGGRWQAYKGWSNVILSKFALKMTGDRMMPAGERGLAMALVDLPDARFDVDLYVMNNHWKCCDGTANDPLRQQQADAIVNWLRDARSAGGEIDLPAKTAVIVAGDLNIVGGPQPLSTVLSGDIQDEARYGSDAPPDWDGTEFADAHPRHNHVDEADYTWRNDLDRWDPGRLDFVLYSDSVLTAVHSFVLNPTTLDEETLAKTGLKLYDVTLDSAGKHFDHLPVVVDFRMQP